MSGKLHILFCALATLGPFLGWHFYDDHGGIWFTISWVAFWVVLGGFNAPGTKSVTGYDEPS